MLSLEPLTIGRLVYAGDGGMERVYAFSPTGEQVPFGGSPQLFQTGESYQGVAAASTCSTRTICSWISARPIASSGRASRTSFGADLVGSPTLGPTPFMHRESARDNPQVPLTHHDMDSTHISEGVLRAGIETGPMTFEASVFRGEEPDQDDNRYNIEKPALDSWAARVGWHRGPVAGAVLGRTPAQSGVVRAVRDDADHRVDRLQRHGRVAPARRHARVGPSSRGQRLQRPRGRLSARMGSARDRPDRGVRTRSRSSAKQIFGLGLHPAGFNHPHFYSHIDAADARRSCATSAPRDGAGSASAPTPRSIACREDLIAVLRRLAIVSRLPAMASRTRLLTAHVHYEVPAMLERIAMPPLGDTCQSSPCPNCSAPPCATPPAPCADGCARSRSRRRTIRPASRS